MALTEADFLNRFVWTKDTINSWRIMDFATGPIKGDCDDYASTMLWITEGNSLANFWDALKKDRARIYIVTGAGGGLHSALWYRGKGWTDSQNRFWGPRVHPIRYKASIKKIQGHFNLRGGGLVTRA